MKKLWLYNSADTSIGGYDFPSKTLTKLSQFRAIPDETTSSVPDSGAYFGRHLFGWRMEMIVFGVGRLVFPLFALVLLCNVARPGDQAAPAKSIALRLAFACAVITLAAIFARGRATQINIFGIFGLGIALCWVFASESNLAWRMVLCGLVAIAGL